MCVILQGKFKMLLKAQRMVEETPVCQMDGEDTSGKMRIKPTTFSAAVNVEASVLCPVCDCEKVAERKKNPHKHSFVVVLTPTVLCGRHNQFASFVVCPFRLL